MIAWLLSVSPWYWFLAFHLTVGAGFAVSLSLHIRQYNRKYPRKAFRHRSRIFVILVAVFLWPLLVVAFLMLEVAYGRRLLSRITRTPEGDLPTPAAGGSLDTLPPGPQWWSRLATRLSHYQPLLLLFVVATDLAMNLNVGGQRIVLSVAYGSALAVLVVSVFADLYHERRLCYRCAVNTPLDGVSEAERYRRVLRFFHWSTRRPWYILLWVLTVALSFAFTAFWLFYPLYLLWAVIVLSALRHRLLEPWCPQCQWRDGGDDEDVPVPPPVPANQISPQSLYKRDRSAWVTYPIESSQFSLFEE